MSDQLTEFTVLANGNLKIALTPEGEAELSAYLAPDLDLATMRDPWAYHEWIFTHEPRNPESWHNDRYDVLRAWGDAVEYEVCHGYNEFTPAFYGLTACPYGICDTIDDNGDPDGRMWWYERYQIDDPVEQLLRDGFIILERADEDEDEADQDVTATA